MQEATAPSAEAMGEDTRNLEAPDAEALVEHMLALVGVEAEALRGEPGTQPDAADADTRRADLDLRLALAMWDAHGDRDQAAQLVEDAAQHPLAPRLRLAVAIAAGTPEAIGAAQTWLEGMPPDPLLGVELAEAWLWRFGRPELAASIAERVLVTGGDSVPRALRDHARELAVLGHAAANAWPRVVALRRAQLAPDSPPERIATSAALLLDRGGDAAGALKACWLVIERATATQNPLGWLRIIDVAIDAATELGDARRLSLLERRAALLGALSGGALEGLATKHAIAAEHTHLGEHAKAAALYTALADDPANQLARAAGRIAAFQALLSATAASAGEQVFAARRRLADSECAEVAATHAWRALELASISGGLTSELAAGLAQATGNPLAESWLDTLEVAAPTAATIARFERRGGAALRWAAAIAERLADRGRARGLWKRAATEASLGSERDHVARLLRTAEDTLVGQNSNTGNSDDRLDELSTTYGEWAAAETRPRAASALHAARGVVDLARGDFVEAEEALQRAAELDPRDPLCRAALAAVYRAGKRYDLLANVLSDLSQTLISREGRASAAREHAELLDEHLGDPAGARAALERMLLERPEDDEAMVTLAKLYDHGNQPARANELRRRAAQVAPPHRRGELWLELARTEEARGDRDAALLALEQASRHTAVRMLAVAGQTRLLRSSGKLDRALELVRGELAANPAPAVDRRLTLQREQAQLLTELKREPETVVAAYLDILALEPDQTEALAGIEAPARQLGMWDELARAFRGAVHTPHNLEVLAEALTKTSEWGELADVRRRQLELATSPADKAKRGDELAHLYERELGDNESAIRALQAAQAAHPAEARNRDLIRLLRTAQRWPELAAALEREQAREPARQLEILLELGELRATRLAKPNDAITAYEGVMERSPGHAAASAALEKLYEQQGRERELAHLIELRANAEQEPVARGALFARVAALRANRGDIDGAMAAYTASFAADPTNRDVFTAMERVCYKSERWAAAMALYDTAIAHVEAGKSRAYRLGDLYSRRASVQLQFLGNVDGAIESYGKVVEVDSNPTVAVTKLEELCAQRNDWSPLIAAWEKRAETQREPGRRTEALRNAAKLATERAGDDRKSVKLTKALLAIDPSDAQAASKLERYYETHEDSANLVDLLKTKLTAATSPDDSVEILRKIARTSEEGGRDVDTATEHYLKILEIQVDNRDALDALARIYESTEQWAEFIEVTRKLIKVTTDRSTKALLYFRCGSVMEAKFGREHDAIRYYDAAIRTSAACLPAVHGLRDLYRRREEWPRVIETLELEVKLWQDDKERAGVFAQIGRIYEVQLGDAERATNFYESALTIDPECVPANQALFEQMFERGEWVKAGALAATLAQKSVRDGDPQTRSEFFRKRGIVARMTGDPRSAADSLVYALEIRPLHTAALDDLGALARDAPDTWDFDGTYKELDKVYRKLDHADALLARVHIGRAVILERDGDLDGATALYRDALALAPADFTVLSAIVDFHADMRRWSAAVAAIDRFVSETNAPPADRLAALMRQAGIHADGEMDAVRAIAVLTDVIRFEPAHQDAHYELAQQCFLIGRYAEARAAIDRVIELATAPGQPLSAEALARYYYYKGRILDAAGDARAAAPQYRRAIEYDPGYAPPALVLARRASDGGDQRQAETLLIEAAHAAMAQGGPRAAVALQRGLARMLLAQGDRPGAIEAYRGILNVDPDGASDRVALAEIYAVDDPARAITELRKVLDRDIHHAPAYRLLAGFYSRTGDGERAYRVLTALDLLGFAEDTDRATADRLRTQRVSEPLLRALEDEPRDQLLANAAATEPLGEVFESLAEEVSALVVPPSLGENLQPAQTLGDVRLMRISAEVAALYLVEPEIFVGDKVPGLAAFTAYPRRMIVLDRGLLGESDAALRFLFGMACEAIRGGYATLLQLGARQRREMVQLLRGLVAPETDRTGPAAELAGKAPPRAAKVLERHAGLRDADASAWLDGMAACAKRAGLLACDDFAAAIWMVARLSGEQLPSHDAAVALGAVLGGPDLVRFYLSDPYQQLRDQLVG